MKKVLKVMSVFAVTLVAAMFMVACGSSNGGTNNPDNNTTGQFTSVCNIDNLNGYYANFDAKKIYYIDVANKTYKHALIDISSEPNQDNLYQVRVTHLFKEGAKYTGKLRVPNNGYAIVNKVWNDKGDATNLVSSYHHPEENKDLSMQFYAEDEEMIYTKISDLGEFLATVFPGKEVDKTDTTYAYEWENELASI